MPPSFADAKMFAMVAASTGLAGEREVTMAACGLPSSREVLDGQVSLALKVPTLDGC